MYMGHAPHLEHFRAVWSDPGLNAVLRTWRRPVCGMLYFQCGHETWNRQDGQKADKPGRKRRGSEKQIKMGSVPQSLWNSPIPVRRLSHIAKTDALTGSVDSDNALCQHCTGNLHEAGDVGTHDQVVRMSEISCRCAYVIVYVLHDTFQSRVDFLEGP